MEHRCVPAKKKKKEAVKVKPGSAVVFAVRWWMKRMGPMVLVLTILVLMIGGCGVISR